MKRVRERSIALCAVVMAIALMGCPAKKKPGTGDVEGQGLGQGEMGGGSLDKFKQGLGPGEGGPLQDVHFDYDRYDLRTEDRATLQQNANWLKEHAGAKVEIEGHCDNRGTVEYNLALGAKRAKAVKDYLVSLGIAADRLSTISYGEELPLCREDTEECWARNRRAHSVVLQ
jgi:peptidoglycan-associated lipoprotein